MKIIAVDFDGTLCVNAWPKIGSANWPTIHKLLQRQAGGDKLILWTCREGKLLEEALNWCRNRGMVFDAVNDNLAENIADYQNNPRKIFADEYWDDKAVAVHDCHFYSNGFDSIYFVEGDSPVPNGLMDRLRFLFTGRR